MNNKTIAELLANLCYKPKQNYSGEFAAQLFVEKVVLPDEIGSYTEKDIEELILGYLNRR